MSDYVPLDENARVYADHDDSMEWACMWLAGCPNPANGLRNGPIGMGEFGPIPICARCDAKCDRLSR